MTVSFKEFLDAVERGEVRHDLFIAGGRVLRAQMITDLFNEANKRGMSPIWQAPHACMLFGESVARMRVAHPQLDLELAGLDWTGVHGLDALNALDPACAERIKGRLLSRVCLVPAGIAVDA